MPEFNKTFVENLETPRSGQKLLWDDKVKGFGIRLNKTSKVYFAQSRVNGKARRVTIGKHGIFTLQEARKKAKKLIQEMTDGVDPVMVKKQKESAAITLMDAARQYKKLKRTKQGHPLKPNSIKDIDKHLKKTFKNWQDKPLSTITTEMVQAHYRNEAEKSTAQANQAFRILRAIYNWTKEKVAVDGALPENPVSILKGEWGHVPTRNGKIPADKFGMAWNYIQEQREGGGSMDPARCGFDLLLFLLVTGARFTEGAALPWEDVNLDDGWWRLPDPKNRNPVKFPLSSIAKSIIEARPKINDFVFYGTGKTGRIREIRHTVNKLGEHIGEKLIPHDMRRSFVLAAGQANVEFVRCKLLMNHKLSGDVTVNSYMDTEDLRWLSDDAEKIAQWMEHQGRIAAAENVVDINTTRQGAVS